MKKNVNKRIAEKSKKPKKPKSKVDEIIKGQINLFQFCNSLSTKIHELEMNNQKLHHELSYVKRDNEELKRILEMVGKKISELRDRISEEDGPQMPKETQTQKQETEQQVKKLPPLHDDVTVKCEMCDRMYHIKSKACPHCGYEKKSK